jgi:hypothetical protein
LKPQILLHTFLLKHVVEVWCHYIRNQVHTPPQIILPFIRRRENTFWKSCPLFGRYVGMFIRRKNMTAFALRPKSGIAMAPV